VDKERVQEKVREIKRFLSKNYSPTISTHGLGHISINGIIIESSDLNQIFKLLVKEQTPVMKLKIIKLIIIMKEYVSSFIVDIFPDLLQMYEVNGNEEINGEIIHIFVLFDSLSVPYLKEYLNNDKKDKYKIIHIIGNLKSVALEFVEDLITILSTSPENDLRSISALSLGKIKDFDAVKPLAFQMLTNDNFQVRKNSAWALGQIQSEEAIEALISALDDEEIIVQTEVAKALGDFYKLAAKASNKLMEIISKPNLSDLLLKEIMWALGKIGVCESIPQIINNMKFAFNPMIREEAIKVIDYLYHKNCKNANEAIHDLISISKRDPDMNVRIEAKKVLTNFCKKSGLTDLDEYIKTVQPYPDKLDDFWDNIDISEIEDYFDQLVEITTENKTLLGINYFIKIKGMHYTDSFNVFSLLIWLGEKVNQTKIDETFSSLSDLGLIQEYMGGYRLTKEGRKKIREITTKSKIKDKINLREEIEGEPTMSNEKPIAFMAYVNEDKDEVEELYIGLSSDESPVKPWMYSKDKTVGRKTKEEIEEIINLSKFAIICLSNNSYEKGKSFFHKEIRISLEIINELPPKTIFLLPVRFDKCTILDYSVGGQNINDLNYCNYFEDDGFQQIIKAINAQLEHETKS